MRSNSIVYIIHTPTGELRLHPYDWNDNSEFMWTDSNYACDCNRWFFFFLRAADEDEPEEHSLCGDNEFYVVGAELADGRWIKLDEQR